MCGIVGYVGDQNATEILLDGLRRLEYRGYDSAGIAVLNGHGAEVYRSEGKLINLEREVLRKMPHGTIGIGHTRWATHGRPSEANAHPHRAGPIMVTHNGIIENYDELRRRLVRDRGRRFRSETDTEVIAHLMDHYCNGRRGTFEAFQKTIAELKGSFAITALNEGDRDHIYIAKRGSPLVVGLADHATFVASDIPALLPYTRKVLFLQDGEYGVVSRKGLTLFNQKGQRVKRAPTQILWDQTMAEKGGFRHFMLKEIYEQPETIIHTLAGRINHAQGKVTLPDMARLLPRGAFPYDKVYLVACGTSYHAALVGKYLIETMARIPVFADMGSEFRFRTPVLDKKTLLITISQSGETYDTLAAIRKARRQGAKVISICNVIDSSIPRESDGNLYTHAGPEIGVASTKAFVAQLTVLIVLTLYLAERTRRLKGAQLKAAIAEVTRLPGKVRQILNFDQEIAALARRYTQAKSFLYFGRGVHYPVALEGALKLKEISYIHAEGYSAGEMKHGPIALIDRGMPVLVLAPQDSTYEKILGNIEEVKARGADVIAVATRGDKKIAAKAGTVLYLPQAPWFLQPILEVVPLQLLAYHIADLKGTDVDQPRNLAKSVTVE